jgi:WD40 repeat protein
MAVQSYDSKALDLYELVQSKVVKTLDLPATNRLISPFDVSFSPDGTRLAVAAWDGAHVLSLDSGATLAMFPERFARTAEFVDSGRSLLVSGNTSCRLWSLEAPAAGASSILAPGHGWNVAASSESGAVVALARGDEVWVIPRSGVPRILRRPPQQFQRVALSPNGKWLAASGRLELGFAVWDLETGESPTWAPASRALGSEVIFSPDGGVLVIGDWEQYAAYSTRDGRVLWRIPRHDTATLHGLGAFTADGRFFACALSRTDIGLHRASSGERLAVLEHPNPKQILALAFSRDGTHLAVASPAHEVRVWDLKRLGTEIRAAGLPWDLDGGP